MKPPSRKQREIQQREQLILDVAAELLHQHGYLGFNMERIAEACEYSKGTVYQHFGCKEEILCALLIRAMDIQLSMFAKALRFIGQPREKLGALLIGHQLFVKLHKRAFSNINIIKNHSIRDKVSPLNQQVLLAQEHECLTKVAQVVQEAIDNSDLALTDVSIPGMVFGLWSTSFGAAQLQTLDIPFAELGMHEPLHLTWKHAHRTLDGYGWRPLSCDWDYAETFRRICRELFADETAQINLPLI